MREQFDGLLNIKSAPSSSSSSSGGLFGGDGSQVYTYKYMVQGIIVIVYVVKSWSLSSSFQAPSWLWPLSF